MVARLARVFINRFPNRLNLQLNPHRYDMRGTRDIKKEKNSSMHLLVGCAACPKPKSGSVNNKHMHTDKHTTSISFRVSVFRLDSDDDVTECLTVYLMHQPTNQYIEAAKGVYNIYIKHERRV